MRGGGRALKSPADLSWNPVLPLFWVTVGRLLNSSGGFPYVNGARSAYGVVKESLGKAAIFTM